MPAELLLSSIPFAPLLSSRHGHLLALPVILLEGTNLNKVDVGSGSRRPCRRVAVGRFGIIGNQVSRLQPEIFKEKRVRGGNGRIRRPPAVEVDGFLGSAVHRIAQIHSSHCNVVFGPDLGKNLFDACSAHIPHRAGNRYSGGFVLEDIDVIFRGSRMTVSSQFRDKDFVGSRALRNEAAGEFSGSCRAEIQSGTVVENQVGFPYGKIEASPEIHLCSLERRDIALIVHGLGRHSGVGREIVGEIQPLDARLFDNLQGIDRRTHTSRFNKVLLRIPDIDKQVPEIAAARVWFHRHGVPWVGCSRPPVQTNIRGVESDQLRVNQLIVPLGDFRIAGIYDYHHGGITGRFRPGDIKVFKTVGEEGRPPRQKRQQRTRSYESQNTENGQALPV